MKTIKNIVILLFFLLNMGCRDSSNPSDNTGESQEKGTLSSKVREYPYDRNDTEYENVVRGNTQFALDLYGELVRDHSGENIFFSPYSISSVMAMLYAGARGDTAAEMRETMHFIEDDTSLQLSFNWLDYALNNLENDLEVQSANALWIQKGYRFYTSYLDTLMENYGAGVRAVDFVYEPEAAVDAINEWVAEKTGNRITNVIDESAIDASTRMVLSNAVYFKAYWPSPFDENLTYNEAFYLPDGTEESVEMMHEQGLEFHHRGENYNAIRLGYKSSLDYAMYVVLPDVGMLDTVVANLDAGFVADLNENMTVKDVNLSFPKFSYETEYLLKPHLNALGMHDVFSPGEADLSGIDGSRDLFIGALKHKAVITVNEKGTEAAAVTIAAGGGSSIEEVEYEEVEMKVNRPFLFFIAGRDDDILFMGRVVNPNE